MTLPLAGLALALAACGPDAEEATGLDQADASSLEVQFAKLAPAYQQELAAVRAMDASVRDTSQAADAGYVAQVTECRNNQPTGGMGWHYLNPDRITDVPIAGEPQVLVFAPKNGRAHLGAVEYIVPYALVPREATPPELFGMAFHPNDGDGVWMLHVWLWRHNPAGLFADWNPAVDCD